MFIVKSVVSMRVVVMLQVYRLHTKLSRSNFEGRVVMSKDEGRSSDP